MFTVVAHPRWTNLTIYPRRGELEREIGLLSDIAESFEQNVCFESENEFVKQNVTHFNESGSILVVWTESENVNNGDIVFAPDSDKIDYFKKISFMDKSLYFNEHCYSVFKNNFWYYYEGNQFQYDNLICLAMIVKDAGPNFENILKENLPFIDRWCILDTGSTDGTQETIRRVLKNKKGTLYEEPFVNFKDSRNRCLDLAGTTCKFIVMLDDTYILKGNLRKFLHEVRGDTFSDSFSLMIQSDDTEYYSNRIIKSQSGLRYIHTIHEVITDQNNINVTIPSTEAYIFDHRSDYMEQRTTQRKQKDLELLFQELHDYPDDPRSLYYIAQTYGCIGDEINKAKYFELRIAHHEQGYVQEKIDALFELARCYNFKVNCETQQLMDSPLTETQWKRCEELYTEAYQLDTNRPDSLYFIGIHYYLEKDYPKAYIYFKQAFEIGYPINSQYSLKPTLSYHYLPKFLTETCYYLEDYPLGLASAELFLTNNPVNQTVSNWLNIHKQLCKMPKIKIFCIVTDGGWEPWTGKDILTKGLGGSETWIIETAKYLSRSFNVIVFCNTLKPEMYENVGYNPINTFHSFIATTVVEYCIISRYQEYLPVALKGQAKNVGVIFHDILLPETILPIDPKLKWVWGLTKWHATQIKKIFPQFNVLYQYYGVSLNENNLTKIKNSFIYSSFPNRGLVVLLKMWRNIKNILPDSTLNIYCNLEHEWVNKVNPEMMQQIKKLIDQPDITVHGWVNKNVLAEAWSTADYWLYPCIFEETFCLTALEAAISKTKVITNGLAGLAETAKYGVVIPGDPNTLQWQMMSLNSLKKYNEHLIRLNYKWAKTLTWKMQTKCFMQQIFS